jgi:hypothetical protein
MLRTVLLPEPEGPSKATNSPRRTLNETSRTASMAVPASWNVLFNPLTSIRSTSSDRSRGIVYLKSWAFNSYPGYAFLATAAKSGLTTWAMVSGLMPVISRNQTFSPRAKLAASTMPS